jgi:hypothetical protein
MLSEKKHITYNHQRRIKLILQSVFRQNLKFGPVKYHKGKSILSQEIDSVPQTYRECTTYNGILIQDT